MEKKARGKLQTAEVGGEGLSRRRVGKEGAHEMEVNTGS